MLEYPWSILGYLALGMLGSIGFLFALLLLEKDLDILKNKVINDLPRMAAAYVVFGGIVSVIVNVTSNPTLTSAQFVAGFGAGVSWPAIVAGTTAGKNIADIKEQARKALDILNSRQAKELQEALGALGGGGE